MYSSSPAILQTSSGIFEAVVPNFKKIRLPAAFGGQSPGEPLILGDDIFWLLLSTISLYCMFAAFVIFVGDSGFPVLAIVLGIGFIIHLFVLYSVVYWCRDKPFRLIGANVKLMVEVIPMITAAALSHLLEFNYGYLTLLLGCTTYFYAFAHFMRTAYDIGKKDVLLGSAMQVLVYMWNVEFLVRALALSLCFCLCFCRYVTYSAPEVPTHRKKEMEWLPR